MSQARDDRAVARALVEQFLRDFAAKAPHAPCALRHGEDVLPALLGHLDIGEDVIELLANLPRRRK